MKQIEQIKQTKRWQQTAWFAVLYVGGVVTVAVLSYALRALVVQ